MVSKMKVEELKSFLRVRGMKLSGNKSILVARVFIAIENNVEPLPTAKEVEKTLSVEYNTKINSYGIPDPFLLKNGWLKEESGICNWPPTSYPEIFNFLSFPPSELTNNDLSDYKTYKAYSYYANGGWVLLNLMK